MISNLFKKSFTNINNNILVAQELHLTNTKYQSYPKSAKINVFG